MPSLTGQTSFCITESAPLVNAHGSIEKVVSFHLTVIKLILIVHILEDPGVPHVPATRQ